MVKQNTRSAANDNLSIPKLSTKTGQKSFYYRGVSTCNSLPLDVRTFNLDRLKGFLTETF